jgi:hypothetical protein
VYRWSVNVPLFSTTRSVRPSRCLPTPLQIHALKYRVQLYFRLETFPRYSPDSCTSICKVCTRHISEENMSPVLSVQYRILFRPFQAGLVVMTSKLNLIHDLLNRLLPSCNSLRTAWVQKLTQKQRTLQRCVAVASRPPWAWIIKNLLCYVILILGLEIVFWG